MSLTPAELGPFGVRMRTALEPWMTPSLEVVCAAIGAMGYNALLELIEEVGTEGEAGWVPPWGKLFDVDLCPANQLPFLAQMVGVELPVGIDEAEARQIIKEEPAAKRGTRSAIESSIRRSLTGEKQFNLIERRKPNGEESGYHFLVSVIASELPSQAVLETNIRSVKPAGVMFTVQVNEGWRVSEGENRLESDAMTVEESRTRRM